jgi:hypothetical protein
MSKFPTIPEFVNSPEEMSAALRAVKQVVEQLAGLRQGQSRGSPQVFVQATTPIPARNIVYRPGDLWINTSNNKLNFWTGSGWQAFNYT